MELGTLQAAVGEGMVRRKIAYRSGTEIMLMMTEELGEVATEVALLEQIGSKALWQKDPSVARLAEELTHLLNNTFALANHFDIDLSEAFREKQRREQAG
jgi:NTP pyrophosphatase (non-canonical NTP hydrolase)